jgi:antitoxin CptB
MQAPDSSPSGLPPREAQSGVGGDAQSVGSEASDCIQTRADDAQLSAQRGADEAQSSIRRRADEAWRRRLRWRARRGLLENDLVFERFFNQFGDTLDDQQVLGLDELLDLSDNELLDLILGRTEPGQEASPAARRVLETLRSV